MTSLPTWAVVMLQVAFFAIIILVVYKQFKERLLYKYNPNKWVVLGAAGLVFMIPIIANEYYNFDMMKTAWQYLDSTVFIILFLWFVDIANGSMRKFGENKNKTAAEAFKASNNPVQAGSAKKNKKHKNRDSRRRK